MRIKVLSVLLLILNIPAHAGLPGQPSLAFHQNPCATGSVAIGTLCSSGVIYAGYFLSASTLEKKIMIMPSGCDGTTANPSCTGGDDTTSVRMPWSTSAALDEASIPNETFNVSYRTYGVIADLDATAQAGSVYPAMEYCEQMVFGGYDDWYLPTKSEMAYLYCKVSAGAGQGGSPSEDTNCTNYGGTSGELFGHFDVAAGDFYWTSSEDTASPGAEAIAQAMLRASNGQQNGEPKSSTKYGPMYPISVTS